MVVFNPRGVGVPQVTGNIFDSAETADDLRHAVKHIKAKHPKANLYIVGNSLGGSIGFQYISRYNKDNHIKGMVSIGNPFDLESTFNSLNSWRKWHYGFALTRYLVSKVEFNIDAIQAITAKKNIDFSLKDLRRSKTTFEYDRKFIFKFHNYSSPKEYYDRLSCVQEVSKINVPLLVIHSKNDPIAPWVNKCQVSSFRGT